MSEENVTNFSGNEKSTFVPPTNPDFFTNSQDDSSYDINSAENTLKGISTFVLWAGIIGTLVCLFTLTTTKVVDPTYQYSIHYDTVFNPEGLVISFGVLISSITTWSLLRVIANISTSLKEINAKMK